MGINGNLKRYFISRSGSNPLHGSPLRKNDNPARRSRQPYIYFANKQVVHAELGGKIGEEVVYELLSWNEGTFRCRK